MMGPDPLSRLFAALLAIGAVGYVSVLWTLPAYYKVIPRGVTLVTRTLYCVVAGTLVVAAYFELREPHPGTTIVIILACSTLANLVAIGLERLFLWRHQRGTNPRD
ncbi:MAG TPA: hypothetical protein VN224_05180 [Xanthomonadales bacterium]|nr:hypothetical protein [Xanthomonadales bacterium]